MGKAKAKGKPPVVAFTPAQTAQVARALNRTWQAVGGDVLACTGGVPLTRAEVLDATVDYVDMYGGDKAAAKLLNQPGAYAAVVAVLPQVFPHTRYGY